jgi:polar amino acid transport system substrate-binding protein
MRYYKFTILIIIISLFFIACGIDKSNDEISATIETNLETENINDNIDKSKIVIAIGEWSPYVSKKLDAYGYAAEIVTKSFKNVGIDIEFEFLPWARSIERAKRADVLGTFPWGLNKDKKDSFDITTTFCFTEEKFIYLKKNSNMPNDFTSSDDLKNIRVSSIKDYSHIDLMEKYEIEFDVSNNDSQAITKLLGDRFDTYPVNPLIAMAIMQSEHPERIDDIDFLPTPLIKIEMGLLISKIHPDQQYYIQEFNKGLKILIDSGEYDNILIKHKIKE